MAYLNSQPRQINLENTFNDLTKKWAVKNYTKSYKKIDPKSAERIHPNDSQRDNKSTRSLRSFRGNFK